MEELNLWLDSYDDIYSDFDSRHYLKRRISEDFLHELRIEMKYKGHRANNMLLLLPGEKRNEEAEKVIAESLVIFFNKRYKSQQEKCRKKLHTGIFLFIAGIIIMFITSWLNYYNNESSLVKVSKVLLEPAGWFLLWAAFDFLYYDFNGLKKERDFFQELSEMNIHFKSA